MRLADPLSIVKLVRSDAASSVLRSSPLKRQYLLPSASGTCVTEPVDSEQPEAAAPPAAVNNASRRPRLTREERLELERERILASVASGEALRLQERVAWILSTQPPTRNSDAALQLAYWQEYETEVYEQWKENPEEHYKRLTRLTSIARARAKIQNQHRLFQASPEIRKRRGRLSEEERERHAADTPPRPTITVFADESGKTQATLIVGSVWFLDPVDTFRLVRRVQEWRQATGFDEELHFTDLTPRTLERYIEFVELIIGEAPLISFKYITMPRAGLRAVDDGFQLLFYELMRRGLQHEHDTGRAPMPRQLMLWKDEEAEGKGRDLLILAKLRESLTLASGAHFDGQFCVETCEALPSKHHALLQLADLYTGSINRSLVRAHTTDRPKDVLADYLLDRVRGLAGTERTAQVTVDALGDVEVQLRL